ncbi:MAG: hypothetical protein AAF698_00725 [Pseudomonadota bacterium]
MNRIFAATFVAATLVPAAALAQGTDSGSFIDLGGGLLAEPADPLVNQPGVLGPQAAGGGAADPAGPVAPEILRRNEGTGPLVTIGLSTGVVYDDEEDEETEAYFVTRVDIGLLADTRNQTFRFDFGVEGRIEEGMGISDFTEPEAQIAYALANRSTQFELFLSWSESDVESDFLPANFDDEDLITDQGTEERHAARILLETGRDARFGTITSLGFSQIDYTDTTDPDLANETTYDASTTLRFTLDRRVDLRLFASWVQSEEDNAEERRDTDTRYGIGADILLSPAWTGTVDLAITDSEVRTTGGTTDTEGYDIRAEATRFLPNGQLIFSVGRVETDAPIDTIAVTRSLALASGAQISASAGLVAFDGEDIYPAFGLAYQQEIVRGGVLFVTLTQTGGETDDDEDLFRTLLNAVFERELTRNSSIAVTGAVASVDRIDGSADDTLAASLGLAYSHDLTEDWALVARADHRRNFEDGSETDRESEFSLRLERTFSFRP